VKVEECVTDVRVLPSAGDGRAWDTIVVDRQIKDRLLHQALFGLLVRPRLRFEVTALHGLIMLYGPPGTGKTTLAQGLPAELVAYVAGGQVRIVEVSPHGLMSAEHGQSQQRVTELLAGYVPSLADDGMPTIVVLDEVEAMTVARSAASLSANPADVHRATDAVLTALDRNAATHPHLLAVATSNFTDTLDEAFLSRCDTAILIPLPTSSAIVRILAATLREFAVLDPALGRVAESPTIYEVAGRLDGIDGRQARKFVTEAMTRRLDTVLEPGALTPADLLAAAEDWAAARVGVRSTGDPVAAA
jgi:SpoVK/Ycf46/Vps4 family AAA+-type ATPase